MKRLTILLFMSAVMCTVTMQAQVAINQNGNDADPNSVLDVRDAAYNPALYVESATGNVAVHNTTPDAADIFSSYATGTNWAINGYSENAPAVLGASSGTGDGIWGIAEGNGDGIYGFANKAISLSIFGVNHHNAPADSSVVAISGAAGLASDSQTWRIGLLDRQSGVIGTGNGSGGIGVAGFLWGGSTSNNESAGYFEADFDEDISTNDGPTVSIAGYDNTNNNQFGVYASVPERNDDAKAVVGIYSGGGSYDAKAVYGDASSADYNYGYGVYGVGNYVGVRGFGGPYGVRGTGDDYGVYGYSLLGSGIYGSSLFGTAVYADGDMYADGDIDASGTKSFLIDYPLDPENKYLKHFCVESDEVLLQYRGVEIFDRNGAATVKLPEYYSTINKNTSYQLTAMGAPMPDLYIKREVDNSNTFEIGGGIPGKKVSWLIISERNDPYLQQYPEKRKNIIDKGEKRGKYLMPQLYGQPKEKGINFIREERKDDNKKVIKINKPSLKADKSIKQEKLLEKKNN